MVLPRFRVSLLIQFLLQTILFILYIPLLVISSTPVIITLASLGIAIDIIMRFVKLCGGYITAMDWHIKLDTLSAFIEFFFLIGLGIIPPKCNRKKENRRPISLTFHKIAYKALVRSSLSLFTMDTDILTSTTVKCALTIRKRDLRECDGPFLVSDIQPHPLKG